MLLLLWVEEMEWISSDRNTHLLLDDCSQGQIHYDVFSDYIAIYTRIYILYVLFSLLQCRIIVKLIFISLLVSLYLLSSWSIVHCLLLLLSTCSQTCPLLFVISNKYMECKRFKKLQHIIWYLHKYDTYLLYFAEYVHTMHMNCLGPSGLLVQQSWWGFPHYSFCIYSGKVYIQPNWCFHCLTMSINCCPWQKLLS